jgi:hypothetical protein
MAIPKRTRCQTIKTKSNNVEYPALKGKVIRRVWFSNQDEFTAIVIEFEDDSITSFRLTASISFSIPPEIARLRGGNIVGWRKLKTVPANFRKHLQAYVEAV